MGINARNLRLGPANVYLFTKGVASLTTALAGANSNLRFQARSGGVDGNDITVTYVVSGNNTPLTVAVSDTDITVNVATDGSGAATSTADDVKNAVNASPAAAGLVTATRKSGDDGSGVVTALASAPLVGGVDTLTALDVGALGEGLQVVIGTEVSPLTAAQSGNLAQDEVVSGGRFEITIPFKEVTMENMAIAIPGAILFSDGGTPPVRRLDFGVSVGASMRARATRLEIRPIIGGSETSDPEEILTVYEASPSGSDVTLAYHPTEQREVAATFRGWPNSAGIFGSYGSTEF